MMSFKLDKDNNIVAGSSFLTVTGRKALAQDIKTLLSMWRGEYPFNIGDGIDYMGFFRNQDKQALLSAISARITGDARVATADLDRSQSGGSLAVAIKTTAGEEVSFELD